MNTGKTTKKNNTVKSIVRKKVKTAKKKKNTPDGHTDKKEVNNILSLVEITEQIKTVLPALDDEIKPPKNIKPNTGTRKLYIERYNKKIATLLLIEIATNPDETINDIISSFGYDKNMIHKWRLLNQSFKDSYSLAVEYRQDILLQDSIPERLNKIDIIMEDSELTPQDKHVRIQALNQRIKYTQWLAGKLNRKYADQNSTSLNQQITINAGANRAQSYIEHKTAERD